MDVFLLLAAAKFIAWPIAGAAFIATDMFLFQAFEPVIYKLAAIFVSVPLAGNLVAYDSNLKLHPERAASAVLISNFVALATGSGRVFLIGKFF
jgi:predicted permease